jgi:hypothetical protein
MSMFLNFEFRSRLGPFFPDAGDPTGIDGEYF